MLVPKYTLCDIKGPEIETNLYMNKELKKNVESGFISVDAIFCFEKTTQFHLQTLVRGPKSNFFQKLFAKGAIESEQKSVYEKMKQRLQ